MFKNKFFTMNVIIIYTQIVQVHLIRIKKKVTWVRVGRSCRRNFMISSLDLTCVQHELETLRLSCSLSVHKVRKQVPTLLRKVRSVTKS